MAKQSRSAKGREAEDLASSCLTSVGFQILYRNYRIQGGEVDIIALEGETLCFVEVRYRSSSIFGFAVETISDKKKAFLIKTAEHFLAHQWKKQSPCRFDMVCIDGIPPQITLYRNVF